MQCIKCKKIIEENSIYCNYCGKKQISEQKKKYKKRPNGTGNIYKIPGGRAKPYRVRKTIYGQSITIGTYATSTEALIALENFNLHKTTAIQEYTVKQIYDMLVEQNKNKLSKSGMTNYISGFNYMKPIQNMKMKEIRTFHFQEAITLAQKNGKGYATWKKIQNLGSLMCKLAMANDIIDKNYAQLINMPETAKKTDKVTFSNEQLKKLWQLWETDNVIMAILALCYNGLRINEFLELKKEHIDIKEQIIYAPGSKTEAGRNRIIAIPKDILPIYEKMLKSEGEYLYPSPTGARWDAKNFRDRAFYKTLKKYNMSTDENGEKITPHSCRHTFAALCVKNNLNQKATMDLIGHSKFSTTVELYAEATKKDIEFLRSEVDKIKKMTPN